MPVPEMSDTITHGVRVGATAFYLPEESEPTENKFVFGYRIVISNEGNETVQLISRKWAIIDGDGTQKDVHGPGVVGQTPVLEPGKAFKYTSFAVLETEWGTMEGTYHMKRTSTGEMFDARIGRFWLTMEAVAQSKA